MELYGGEAWRQIEEAVRFIECISNDLTEFELVDTPKTLILYTFYSITLTV